MKAEFLQNFKAGDAPLPKEAGDALKASKDQSADIKAALEGLKKDSGYLFEPEETPPPYAAGTGAVSYGGSAAGIDAIRAAAGLSTDKK